jgi:hypothetical protein
MSLSNHYGSTIRSDVDPRAPGSKFLDAGLGKKYPGGVPYLTDRYLSDKEVNKAPGRRTNGSVRTTVHTRTRDQNYINVDQFAWMDVRKFDHPILLNLQTMNWLLVNDLGDSNGSGKILNGGNDKLLEKYAINGDLNSVRTQAEKCYIMDNFKLYGVVVNRDTDNNESIPMTRIARTFTCTVKNVCHVGDYFSTSKRTLKRYDSCYFVLKKIKITGDMRWENILTSMGNNRKLTKSTPTLAINKYKWQIIPYHNSDNVLPMDRIKWVESQEEYNRGDPIEITSYNGGMWRLGKIHEYADICTPSTFTKRFNETVVARDLSELHGRGRITPIHFYLKIEEIY